MSTLFPEYPTRFLNTQLKRQWQPHASEQADVRPRKQLRPSIVGDPYELNAIKGLILDCLAVYPLEVRAVLDAARASPFDGLADDQIRGCATVLAGWYPWVNDRLVLIGLGPRPAVQGLFLPEVPGTRPAQPSHIGHPQQVPLIVYTQPIVDDRLLRSEDTSASEPTLSSNGSETNESEATDEEEAEEDSGENTSYDEDEGTDELYSDEEEEEDDDLSSGPFDAEIQDAEECLRMVEKLDHPQKRIKYARRVSELCREQDIRGPGS